MMKFQLGATRGDLQFTFRDYTTANHSVFIPIVTSDDPHGIVSGEEAKTRLASRSTTAGKIMHALRQEYPGRLLRKIEVRAVSGISGGISNYHVTFTGVPGKQELITLGGSPSQGVDKPSFITSDDPDLENVEGGKFYAPDKATVYDGNLDESECSGRGACDYSTGICQCFAGYSGGACEAQDTLVF